MVSLSNPLNQPACLGVGATPDGLTFGVEEATVGGGRTLGFDMDAGRVDEEGSEEGVDVEGTVGGWRGRVMEGLAAFGATAGGRGLGEPSIIGGAAVRTAPEAATVPDPAEASTIASSPPALALTSP